MTDRKMVFFDIDGTILGEGFQIPESAVRAIRKLRENGHLAFINTGRTYSSIHPRIREIGFDGYVCGCGSRIYYQGEEIFGIKIPHEKCVEVIHKLRELNITAFFEAPESIYFDGESPVYNPALEQAKKDFIRMGIAMEAFPENGDTSFDKFYCMLIEKSDVKGLEEYIKGDFYGTPQWTSIEVVQEGRNKAEGIRFLQEKLGIPDENCYAIGDSENDLSMLKAVPHAIAMGQCSPEILPYCEFKTAKVLEDGIEMALKHYGLI